MDRKTKRAINYLKSKGYEIYEGLPTLSDLSDLELQQWRTKISAWGTDMDHARQHHSKAIRAEINRRESLQL